MTPAHVTPSPRNRWRMGGPILPRTGGKPAGKSCWSNERFQMFFRKSVVLGAAIACAAIIPAGGAAMASPASNHPAATPSCGHQCIDPYNREWGKGEVLDVLGGGNGKVGQLVVLSRQTNDNAGEDFTYNFDGPVTELVGTGQLSPVTIDHYAGDYAFELTYSPNGEDSDLCVGLNAGVPAQGWRLKLEPCGVSADTIWIVDFSGNGSGFASVISGTTTKFSHPLAWTYPASATPFDSPRPSIVVDDLLTNSRGYHPNEQQWGARFGVIK